MIDPPRTPTAPIGPKRLLLTLGVTFLGFGAGIGLSLLISQINPVVTSRNQVTKETGIPVFGVISATENLGLQQWHKRKRLIFILYLIIGFSYHKHKIHKEEKYSYHVLP